MEVDPDLIWLPRQTDDPTDDTKLLQIRRPSGEDVVVEFKTHRHLVFSGIRQILVKHCKAREDSISKAEQLRQEILGCRVAKNFGQHFGVYFGQVMSVDRPNQESIDEDLYTVRFDDGDSEEYSIAELYGTFLLFEKERVVFIRLHLLTSTLNESLGASTRTSCLLLRYNQSILPCRESTFGSQEKRIGTRRSYFDLEQCCRSAVCGTKEQEISDEQR